MNAVKLAAAGLIMAAAYYYWQQQQSAADEQAMSDDTDWLGGSEVLAEAGDVLTSASESVAETIDSWTGGFMKISAMAKVDPNVLGNRNVQAMLRVIRAGEGTADDGGYSRMFGGAQFSGFNDHPRQKVTKWGYTSTAAGAYQLLSKVWDETRGLMGLRDFSPASQDLAAVGRIAARGALADVMAGRFDVAIRKLNKEWASLPGSPYGQKTISLEAARSIFLAQGGQFDGNMYA